MSSLRLIFQSLIKQRYRPILIIIQLFIGFVCLSFGLGLVEEANYLISEAKRNTPENLVQVNIKSVLEQNSFELNDAPKMDESIGEFYELLQKNNGIQLIGTLLRQGTHFEEVNKYPDLIDKKKPIMDRGNIDITYIDSGFLSIYPINVENGRTLNLKDFNGNTTQNVPILVGSLLGKHFPIGSVFSITLEDTKTHKQVQKQLTVVGVLPESYNFWQANNQQLTKQGLNEKLMIIAPLQPEQQGSNELLFRLGSTHITLKDKVNYQFFKRNLEQQASTAGLEADIYNLSDKINLYKGMHKMQIMLALTFAILLLLLSTLGLLGIVLTSIIRRQKEFGIRFALGGTWKSIGGMVAGEIFIQVGIAVIFGIIFSKILSNFIEIQIGLLTSVVTIGIMILILVPTIITPLLRFRKWEPIEIIRKGE